MLQYVTVCYSMLQYVTVCYSMLPIAYLLLGGFEAVFDWSTDVTQLQSAARAAKMFRSGDSMWPDVPSIGL